MKTFSVHLQYSLCGQNSCSLSTTVYFSLLILSRQIFSDITLKSTNFLKFLDSNCCLSVAMYLSLILKFLLLSCLPYCLHSKEDSWLLALFILLASTLCHLLLFLLSLFFSSPWTSTHKCVTLLSLRIKRNNRDTNLMYHGYNLGK